MRSKVLFIVAAILLFHLPRINAQATDPLPSTRRIIWNPGIPGGIPEVPVVASVKAFGAKGDGLADDAPAFQKAIQSVSDPGAILIPAGTYLLKSPLEIHESVVLRGEGPDKTRLLFDLPENGPQDALTIVKYDRGREVAVTGGATRGSMALTVADASSFRPGTFLELYQDNDPEVMYTSPLWDQPWAAAAVGQIFRIVSVSGDTLTLDEPVRLTYKAGLNPRVRAQGLVTHAGIEQIRIKRLDAGDGHTILLKNAAYCWVRDVESEDASRSHVSVDTGYRCVIRDSYFHHAHDYGGGGHGYGVELSHHATDCLVENNVFFHLRHAMLVQVGANGNVFGYNCSRENVPTENARDPADISLHGHFSCFNLFEGNVVHKIEVSDHWGPVGPGNTFLRNRVTGGRVGVRDHSHDQNFLGNDIGDGAFRIAPDVTGVLLHGNRAGGNVSWDSGIPTHDLPASYYLTSRPPFFSDTPWPAIGPDIGKEEMIPAQRRYLKIRDR